MRFVFSAVAMLGVFAATADGQCRFVGRNHHAVVVNHAAVVHHAPAIAYYAALPVVTQSYAVGHADNSIGEIAKALIEDNRQMRAMLLQQMSQGGGPIFGAAPKKVSAHAVISAQHCASCHGPVPKGNSYKMFDQSGQFIEPDNAQLEKIIRLVKSGDMPRGRQMSMQDRFDLVTSLVLNDGGAEALNVQPNKLPKE